MLNFDFLEKGLEIISPRHFAYDILRKMFLACYIVLTDQNSLPDCLNFLTYRVMYVLQLFVNQVETL